MPQVNHKDENKTNNNVDNLEWCDATYNLNYGNRSKIASEHRKFKGGNNKINIFVLNENKTIIANTISEAEHITGVTRMKLEHLLTILINQVDILVNLTLMLALLFKLFKLPL